MTLSLFLFETKLQHKNLVHFLRTRPLSFYILAQGISGREFIE